MFWIMLLVAICIAYIINNLKLSKELSDARKNAKKNNYELFTTPQGKTKLTNNNHDVIKKSINGHNFWVDKTNNNIIRDDMLINNLYTKMINDIYSENEKQKLISNGKKYLYKAINNTLNVMDLDFQNCFCEVGTINNIYYDLEKGYEVVKPRSHKLSCVKDYKKLYIKAFSKIKNDQYKFAKKEIESDKINNKFRCYKNIKEEYDEANKKYKKLYKSNLSFDSFCANKDDCYILNYYLYDPKLNQLIINKDSYVESSMQEKNEVNELYKMFVNKILKIHKDFKGLYLSRFKNGKYWYSDAIKIINLNIDFPYLYDEDKSINKLCEHFKEIYFEINWLIYEKSHKFNKDFEHNNILKQKLKELNQFVSSIDDDELSKTIKPNRVYRSTSHLKIKS